MRKTIVIHPFLFALYPIVFLAAHNKGQLFSVKEILIPIAITTCFALLSWSLLSFVLKDTKKAGLLVSLSLFLFFSYGHFYNMISFCFFDEMLATRFVVLGHEIGPNKVLFPVWGILLLLGAYFSIKTRIHLHNFTNLLNIVASFLVLIPLINIVSFELKTAGASKYNRSGKNAEFDTTDFPQADALPDIYYIILDSYVASNTLKEVFGYDNSEFIDHLADKGFYVASKSRSNYTSSYLALASSLNMEYINYLSERLGESKSYRIINQMIKKNKVMNFLRSKGYKFVHFSSGWGATHYNPYADLDLQPSYLNEFSVLILKTTMLRPFLKHFIQSDSKSRILYTFDKLGEVPNIKDPTFAFAHILAPHDYVFGGTYLEQLPIINKKIGILVDAILSKSDMPPIIIFQADHGTAFTGKFDEPTEELIRERMRIFNAYYLPAGGRDLLYESITPVNSFRLIFKYYFGAKLDLLDDYSYFSDYEHPYKFTDVTDILVER